jgi:AcrR family transcriptional regulator
MNSDSEITKGTLRSRHKEATAQEILAAAEALVAAQGRAAASMAAIAQRAGVSVGTLYNYFKDKDELILKLFEVRREELAGLMDQALAEQQDAPFDDRLASVVRSLLSLYDSHRDFLRIAFAGESLPPQPATGSRRPPHLQFIDRLRPLMAQGVDAGRLAPEASAAYAAMLSGMLRGVMIEGLEDGFSFATRAEHVVRVFLYGAASRAEQR